MNENPRVDDREGFRGESLMMLLLLVGLAVGTMRVDAEAECNMLKRRTLASSEAKM